MNIFRHLLKRSLAHVIRFSSWPQHFEESVAEHSFFTAYFTRILCDLLSKEGIEVNKEKAITMALLHDMEEMFSGDILGPFKHHSPEVAAAIRKVNEETVQEAFIGLPDDLVEEYIALWKEEGKGESVEAQIVKKADRLSLVSKCAEEITVGNSFFQEVYDSMLKALREDNRHPWWNQIKGQVLEAYQEA